jgi:broad specificity phosphatase PhoE
MGFSSMTTLTLHVIRHGEVHNPDKILYGRLPHFGLSDSGQAQARAAGAALQNLRLAAIYASPMQRAQETAQAIAAAQTPPLPIHTDERLNEILTPHQGRPLAELELTSFDLYTGIQPPYESPADIQRRLLDFVAAMRQQHPGEQIAAVTHGDNVVTLFLYAQQQSNAAMGRNQLEGFGLPERYPATASILTLTYHTTAAAEIPQVHYQRPY